MKKCNHCGADMEIDQRICNNCNWGYTLQCTKQCKYCKTEINKDANVCPNCKRALSWKYNPIIACLLLIIVAFIIWGISSNNAPLPIRKTVCGLGLRDDFPYCYYVDINKLLY